MRLVSYVQGVVGILFAPFLVACSSQPIIDEVPNQALQNTLQRQSSSHPLIRALYGAGYRAINLKQDEGKTETELTFGPCDLSQKATVNECAESEFSFDQPRVILTVEGVPVNGDFKPTGSYTVVSKRSTDGSPRRSATCQPNQPSDFVLDSTEKVRYLGEIVKQFIENKVVSSGSREVDVTAVVSQLPQPGKEPVKVIWKCKS